MKIKCLVEVQDCLEIHELPRFWNDERFRDLLKFVDFDDWESIKHEELKEYVLMVLQDMPPDEAAEVVLKHHFGSTFNTGHVQSMAHEMMDEKLWEEYKDINLHAGLYNCAVLLRWAFPRKFPETDAIKSVLKIETAAREVLFNKSIITKIIAQGMDDHAVINRLFKDQLLKSSFPEAEGILWDFEHEQVDSGYLLTIYSSTYWLHDLDHISSYEAVITTDK